MKTSTIVSIVVVVAIVIFGGWWLMSSNSTSTPTVAPVTDNTTPTTTPPAPVVATPAPETTPATAPKSPEVLLSTTPVVKVSTSATLGSYLASSTNGMTLYTYSGDSKNMSNCTGGCAASWPPYTSTGKPPFVAIGSVSGQISSFTRANGSVQITYNGMPLYFWVGDKKPGDTTGQGVNGFAIVKQ